MTNLHKTALMRITYNSVHDVKAGKELLRTTIRHAVKKSLSCVKRLIFHPVQFDNFIILFYADAIIEILTEFQNLTLLAFSCNQPYMYNKYGPETCACRMSEVTQKISNPDHWDTKRSWMSHTSGIKTQANVQWCLDLTGTCLQWKLIREISSNIFAFGDSLHEPWLHASSSITVTYRWSIVPMVSMN